MRRRREQRHIDALARTAQLEMSMGVGSYQDTLAEMYSLIGRLEDARKEHRAAEDVLIDQLRRHCMHLESVIHRREAEFDSIEQRLSDLIEQHARCRGA